jgi:hypothetical protein
MGMEVGTGGRLKVGQRVSGVRDFTVSPDGPAAAGIRVGEPPVRTALTRQDGCDTEAFHPSVLHHALVKRKYRSLYGRGAPAPRAQRSIEELIGVVVEMSGETSLRLPQDCRANSESIRYRDQ